MLDHVSTSDGPGIPRPGGTTPRREILRVGGLFGAALTLPGLLRAQEQSTSSSSKGFGRAKSIIMLYLHGGHAQQETFDPKPNAPDGTRGIFGAIDTTVPGISFCELLPRTAKLAHKIAAVRSLTHPNANHVQASLSAMTGHAHPPSEEARGDFPPTPNDFPPIGAVLSAIRTPGDLPTWVQIGPTMRRSNGTVLHGQLPGFLGGRHGPLLIDQDLLAPGVRVEAVAPDPEVPTLRLGGRNNLLSELDSQRARLESDADVGNLDAYQQRAVGLLTARETARAFDLSDESDSTLASYGRTQFGRSCLLARRLAEAGVPMINVHYCRTPVGWDTHGKHFPQMKDSLCPTLDQAFSALVGDLDRRGRLDDILVIVNAEFGRTPKINASGGRDHWPWVYSVALAGGGVRGGQVVGSSDNMAAYPVSHPHDPKDLIATLYHLLGVPAETSIMDRLRRPYQVVIGTPIPELIS